MKKLVLFVCLVALPLAAQPFGKSDPGTFRHEIRLSQWNWSNFYWATEPLLERDVRAIGLEYRTAYRPRNFEADVYAHLNYLNYDEQDRDDSYGVRVGLFSVTPVQEYNVYVDRGENRQSFTAGNVTAQASVTMLAGEYRRNLVPAWMITSEGVHSQQRFDVSTTRDSNYTSLGAGIRYRGFGWRFSPEVGYIVSSLDSSAGDEDDRGPYIQAEYMPHFVPDARLYLSGRYRFKDRDYSAGGRTDDRPEWNFVASYRIRPRISAILYYGREDVNASVPDQDFDHDLLTLTLAWGL
ncbi:MAG TPA: hypothetical protein VHK90_01650 [Thermoanaerobaculia bacterium]|nr:hypothetical protein [Thermoanaerobaculia bacterium]